MIALLLNHLWQSSLCVGGAGLIAVALRRNAAHIRFWLWFAASIKFLVPFAALTALGTYALAPMVPPVAVPTVTLFEPLAKPFSAPPMVPFATRPAQPSVNPAPSAHPARFERSAPPVGAALPAFSTFNFDLGFALLALWAAGFLALAIRWLVRWSQVRAVLREAVEVQVDVPVAVKFSASRLEPGLVGILHPVILFPKDIEQQLSPAELQAVLAHELCHWRRHDNLLAAIHMLMEALFWFFPLVWWLGARLNDERERACDESVLADGNDPQIYAEGILKVCRAYLQSPLACVAGVSGAHLKLRIETIMENRLIPQLNAVRKFVLSASATAALALPLALGLMAVPVSQMQAKAAPIPLPKKITRESIAQTLPPTPESTPAMPTNHDPGDPAEAMALHANEAATSAPKASPSPRFPRSLPAGNPDVPQADVSQPLPETPQSVASNDGQAAPAPHVSDISAAAPAPHNEDAAIKQTFAALAAVAGPNGAAAARTCTLPAIADSVDLKTVPRSNLMTVPVEINGTPKQFLLDIGMTPTEISQFAVTQLGLPENTKLSETIGAGNSNMTTPRGSDLAALTNGGLGNVALYDVRDNQGRGSAQTRVRIGSFTIGRATGHHLMFVVANDADMGKSPSEPYDGLLSGDFFRQYDVELDFGGKQLNFLTPTKCADPGQVVFWPHSAVALIPMTVADGKITVPVSVQGHEINAAIDTSSSRTTMRRDVAELVLGLNPNTDMMLAGDLRDGKGQPVYAHTFSQISFTGGVTANNVPTLILTNGLTHEINSGMILGSWARSADSRIPDLTLGMDVLRQLHLYIVPGQGKLYVTSAE